MKMRTYYLWPLVGMVWFWDGSPALGQGDHQGNHEKDAAGFEHVHALAMDAEGRTLFLGAHTGLFRSDDEGHSWKKVALSPKQSGFDVMGVTPDPRNAKTIYLATHEAGVFKSTDGGTTWKEINTGLGGPDIHGLAIDPNVPSKLHAAVREKGEGIYRTTDGGGKWTRVDDGPGGEVKVLTSVNISTGMGGTAEGLQRSPDFSEGGDWWAVCPLIKQ
ncbi:MAG: hypothetical protein E6J89_10870 [Deltaproteobacteria bacterium]|nr:MAG: hypothetical protein E6J89_10870 [Deltaproteobacteria bacterium]